MKVFSFLSIKGGVGKTTLVSNLATELAIRGKKVLLIDLDLQANLSMAFFDPEEYMQHVSEGRTIRGFYPNGILENLFEKKEIKLKDLILSPRLVNESMDIFSGSNSIDIIISDLNMINMSIESIRPFKLKAALSDLKDVYDVVLIDCPPHIGGLTASAIIASDYYIIPSTPDFLSIMGIKFTLNYIDKLLEDYDVKNPELLGVLFNMVRVYGGAPIGKHKEAMQKVSEMGVKTFNNYLPYKPNSFVNIYNTSSTFIDTNETENNMYLTELTYEFMKLANL
ncbi:AAA family ATPase [Bacillus cereus]|uniref:ParA family protein n=1 Tax=Bacillus cereus TaxID=1396 RepID=UPI0014446A0C|nr:AAA family ATPase [Bacillus cereus]NKW77198.1 AAA family ATPase [Bacillus cereus]